MSKFAKQVDKTQKVIDRADAILEQFKLRGITETKTTNNSHVSLDESSKTYKLKKKLEREQKKIKLKKLQTKPKRITSSADLQIVNKQKDKSKLNKNDAKCQNLTEPTNKRECVKKATENATISQINKIAQRLLPANKTHENKISSRLHTYLSKDVTSSTKVEANELKDVKLRSFSHTKFKNQDDQQIEVEKSKTLNFKNFNSNINNLTSTSKKARLKINAATGIFGEHKKTQNPIQTNKTYVSKINLRLHPYRLNDKNCSQNIVKNTNVTLAKPIATTSTLKTQTITSITSTTTQTSTSTITTNTNPKPKSTPTNDNVSESFDDLSNKSLATNVGNTVAYHATNDTKTKNLANLRLQNLRVQLKTARESQFNDNANENADISQNFMQKTNDREPDAMDWEPVRETLENSFQNHFEKNDYAAENVKLNTTQISMYKNINENLLSILRQQQSSKACKTDYWHFVLDTNILIKSLNFIKELVTMKFSNSNGTVVFIPYIVIKELDNIKNRVPYLRSASSKAIRYINTMLESNIGCVEVQGALKDQESIIDVVIPDDRIINCCLQLKEKITNVILLTEDVNLRNKAFSCKIFATGVNDLSTNNMIMN